MSTTIPLLSKYFLKFSFLNIRFIQTNEHTHVFNIVYQDDSDIQNSSCIIFFVLYLLCSHTYSENISDGIITTISWFIILGNKIYHTDWLLSKKLVFRLWRDLHLYFYLLGAIVNIEQLLPFLTSSYESCFTQ